MSKHTPGPWIKNTDNVDIKNQRIGITDSRLKIVAYIPTSLSVSNRSAEEDFANQDLIAAAPELLEMCNAVLEVLVNKVDRDQHFYREKLIANLREAIAKAEGK